MIIGLTDAQIKMTDEKTINLISEAKVPKSNHTSTTSQINVQEAIKKVNGFVKTLNSGGVPPLDNQQDVIEQIGNAADPMALPVLRRALSSAIQYQRRAAARFDRIDPNTTLAGHLDMIRMTTENMEKRLRQAIASCTPEGKIPICTKKWWEFWK